MKASARIWLSALIRLLFFAGASAVAACIFAMAASAAVYTDGMENAVGDEVKTYYNLSPVVFSGGGQWANIADKSFLSFSQKESGTGHVLYRVRGCEQITVGIYTPTGTFSHPVGTGYALGFTGDDAAGRTARPAGAEQALFSPGNRYVYMRDGANTLMMAFSGHYEFIRPIPAEAAVVAGLKDFIPYGPSVQYSRDGVSFAPVTLSFSRLDYAAASFTCYEEFTGRIPSDAQYIRVEINDCSQFYDLSAGRYAAKTSRFMMSLALVRLEGEALATGTPAPPVSSSSAVPPPSAASQPSSASSSRSASSRRAASSGSGGSGSSSSGSRSAASSSKVSSSKFEGSVVVSQPSSRRSSTAAASSRSETPASSASSHSDGSSREEAMAAPSEGAAVAIRYEPAGQEGDSRFRAVVTAYIVAVCAAIAFVLFRSGKK
ncbi:hypothetical protein LJC63_06865 [Ruminococcaceae bacterium OttesenSCG-928-L11]|nr:hypothetical protein [Ruminococcaceae bacterium OttesenSCG-928-L11]